MSKKWRGPWLGRVADHFAAGSTTIRLYPIGVPTIAHADRNNDVPNSPAAMWGWETVWPLGGQNWFGTASLTSAPTPPNYFRIVYLSGQLTRVSTARAGTITAVVCGVTRHFEIDDGFNAANIRAWSFALSRTTNPFLYTPDWVVGHGLLWPGNNTQLLQTSNTAPQAEGTIASTTYANYNNPALIGADILEMNDRYFGYRMDMYCEQAGCHATYDLSAIYVDVTYTQT